MKQEADTTQITGDTDTKLPLLSVEIKKEIDCEASDEMSDSEDASKSNSCSMNMLGMKIVPETGLYGEDEGKNIKEELSAYTQYFLVNSHDGSNGDSFNSDQHDTCPERLSDNNINSTRDMPKHKQHILKRRENKKGDMCLPTTTGRSDVQGLNKCRASVKIMDSEVTAVDMKVDIPQTVTLNNEDCDKQSENGASSSEKDAMSKAGKNSTANGILNILKRKRTDKKSYKCDFCDKVFTTIGNLNIHRRKHTEEYIYKCDECGVGFTRADHMETHKRKHTGEKPFKCEVCGKVFTTIGNLNVHKRRHSGENIYKCEECGIRFTRADHLKTHKRKHTGEKPYKCGVCGAGFTHTGNLKRHERTHTGEKPYECHVCGKHCSDGSNLKKHMQTHT